MKKVEMHVQALDFGRDCCNSHGSVEAGEVE